MNNYCPMTRPQLDQSWIKAVNFNIKLFQYTLSKVEFVRSSFGGNIGLKKMFQLFLTFNNLSFCFVKIGIHSRNKTCTHESPAC